MYGFNQSTAPYRPQDPLMQLPFNQWWFVRDPCLPARARISRLHHSCSTITWIYRPTLAMFTTFNRAALLRSSSLATREPHLTIIPALGGPPQFLQPPLGTNQTRAWSPFSGDARDLNNADYPCP